MRSASRPLSFIGAWVLLAVVCAGDAGAGEPGASPPVESGGSGVAVRVRQVMGNAVYLDAGRAAGLFPGQRARVVRDGEVIAELEVEYVSTGSAACRRLDTGTAVVAGDLVVPDRLEPPPAASGAAAGETGPPAAAGGRRSERRSTAPTRQPWADLSGSVALRFQGFQDGTDAGRDISQTWGVVRLNMRQIGGAPLSARVRLRAGEETVSRPDRPTERERNDRFYELSVAFAPLHGAYSWQIGRLTAGPEVGFDYLDGMLGEVRLAPHLGVGGFVGNRADVEELAYDGSGQAYGAFVHHSTESTDGTFYSDSFISLIGEYREGETNREFVSLYGRHGSGSRWSLYERAEVDLNRDWRQEAGEASYQLSNLLLGGTYRLSRAVRMGLTYDERRRYRTLDDRETPEELFDDALREGLRLSLYLGSGRGVRANLSAGLRRREGSPEQNRTYNGSVYYGNVFGWNLLLGADFASFSGETSEGYRAGVRVHKYFAKGFDLELNVGRSTTTLVRLDEDRLSEWVRLSGTAQLGRHYFLIGEYETTTGDELAGERLFLQLGYRF